MAAGRSTGLRNGVEDLPESDSSDDGSSREAARIAREMRKKVACFAILGEPDFC